MEKTDVHLVIGKRNSSKDYFPLSIETIDGGKHKAKLTIPPWLVNYDEVLSKDYDIGSLLWKALSDNTLLHLIDEIHSLLKSYNKGLLLLELRATELYRLPWENMFEFGPLLYLKDSFTILRFLSKPSSYLASPLHLPLDVLIFADKLYETTSILPTDDSLQYFRATKSIKVSASHLRIMLKHLQYDIVQITCRAEFRANDTSVLLPGTGESEISAKDLVTLLKGCKARFLALQCVDDNYGALLNFAHQIFGADGPTILLIPKLMDAPVFLINNLYMDIVHNQSLLNIFQNYFYSIPPSMGPRMNPVLLLSEGGSDILKISAVAPRLFAKVKSQLKISKNLQKSISLETTKLKSMGNLDKLQALEKKLKFLEEHVIDSLENELIPIALDFSHESGGMKPLSDIEMLHDNYELRLGDLQTRIKRVVNSNFRQNERIIPAKEGLDPGTPYSYEIQIGVGSEHSNVQNAIAIPEEELARFYSAEGLELRVELFSNDFEIPKASRILILPPPPEESKSLLFDIETPKKAGVARMRASIYFKHNLIQSLLVQAVVGNPKTNTKIRGNRAVVDYSLSSSLTDIEHLPPRALNIAINDDTNGTHSFYIAGKDLKQQFDFGEGEINKAVENARETLQNICREKDGRGKMSYRFDASNRGNEKNFIIDIKNLAEIGAQLYAGIITNQDREFRKKLNDALDKAESVIQISSTKSAKYVFPWSVVYDKPLLGGDTHVCPQFLSDLKKGGPTGYLSSQTCIVNGCIHGADNTIVCPSGFWGIRHIIEQPLSTISKSGLASNDIHLSINAKNGTSLMMGVSLELKGVDAHRKELEQLLGNADVQFMQSKAQIGKGLQDDVFHLVYFYCHGGRNSSGTWLGVGKGEKITPRELSTAWDVYWPTEHPFVFINGCHTADVTPDDLLHFNNAFAYSEASGVMGTEITIPENFARHFASRFLSMFLNGKNVGASVRQQRFELLENYNLLGLAYTPYCSGDLKIIHNP